RQMSNELLAPAAIASQGPPSRNASLWRRARRPALQGAFSLLPWLVVLLVWYLLPATNLVHPALVPTPSQVLVKVCEQLTMTRLWLAMYLSLQRVTLGLVSGITLAVPIGFLLGWSRPARALIDPLINFFRSLPPIALIPLVIVYFGIDELAKVVMLF